MSKETLIKTRGDFEMCQFISTVQHQTGQRIDEVIETGRRCGGITRTDDDVPKIVAMVEEWQEGHRIVAIGGTDEE